MLRGCSAACPARLRGRCGRRKYSLKEREPVACIVRKGGVGCEFEHVSYMCARSCIPPVLTPVTVLYVTAKTDRDCAYCSSDWSSSEARERVTVSGACLTDSLNPVYKLKP